MASALDAVLALRQSEQDQRNYQNDQITKAFESFKQSRQFNAQQQLAQLQTRVQAGQSGLQINPDGSIQLNQDLINPNTVLSSLLQGQATAKQAQNKQMYNLYTQRLNQFTGGNNTQAQPTQGGVNHSLAQYLPNQGQPGANAGQPSGNPNTSGQPLANNSGVQMSGINDQQSPNLATTGVDTTIDATTGQPTSSYKQTNLTGTGAVATQGAQIPNQVAANKAAIEAKTGAEAGATDISNIMNLAYQVNKSGYLDDWLKTSEYEANHKLAPTDVQKNISDLNNSLKRSSLATQAANTASLGEGISKKISVAPPELGEKSTIDDFRGWAKANVRADYYKEIATNNFKNELAKQGLDPNKLTPDQFGAGMFKYWGKLTPNQENELQIRIGRATRPPGTYSYDGKADKFYDRNGKEIK